MHAHMPAALYNSAPRDLSKRIPPRPHPPFSPSSCLMRKAPRAYPPPAPSPAQSEPLPTPSHAHTSQSPPPPPRSTPQDVSATINSASPGDPSPTAASSAAFAPSAHSKRANRDAPSKKCREGTAAKAPARASDVTPKATASKVLVKVQPFVSLKGEVCDALVRGESVTIVSCLLT
jgi:hypothetical protein